MVEVVEVLVRSGPRLEPLGKAATIQPLASRIEAAKQA